MRKLALLLIAVLTLIYPALVYFGLNRFGPVVFAGLFLLAGVVRYRFAPGSKGRSSLAILILVAIYSALLVIVDKPWLIRLYPVTVSFGMAAVFTLSLRHEVSLIESMARAAGKTITANAKHYTRNLTLVWAIILTVNGLIALYLALFATLQLWALYCGLIAYLAMGAFFLAELLFRQYYISKVGE